MDKNTKAGLRTLSGLSINISAGWVGLAFLTPNFTDLSKPESISILIRDIFFGIVFLLLTFFLERKQLR